MVFSVTSTWGLGCSGGAWLLLSRTDGCDERVLSVAVVPSKDEVRAERFQAVTEEPRRRTGPRRQGGGDTAAFHQAPLENMLCSSHCPPLVEQGFQEPDREARLDTQWRCRQGLPSTGGSREGTYRLGVVSNQ